MKDYAEEGKLSQPRKNIISSFTLQNGTLNNPLLLFNLQLWLVVTKTRCFVEYTPEECFWSFVQSAVDARRKSGENPNSSAVATMKFLISSSCGNQIMNRSRHTVTKYISDGKTHAFINICKFLKNQIMWTFRYMSLNSPNHIFIR